jgi:hypothetical protein
LSRSRNERHVRKVFINCTPMGHANWHRPQRVQTQGHLESMTSCSRPKAIARIPFLGSQPGTSPVAGQPLAHVPHVKQRSANSGETPILRLFLSILIGSCKMFTSLKKFIMNLKKLCHAKPV